MQIKILSWNIWVDNYFDQVTDFLKNSDADIIGLQEVTEGDISRETIEYMNSLGFNYVYVPTKKNYGKEGRRDGPAVFSKHQIISSQKYILSEDGMRAAARADILIDGKTLHVFSTHLEHTHQKDSEGQLLQVEELLKHIPAEKSILMGDFNATPESATIKRVSESLVKSDPKNMPTRSVYPEGCVVCKPTGINMRLDYVFTTKDVKIHSYMLKESGGSDHLPISATIEL